MNRFAELSSELSSIAARLAADVSMDRVYGAGDHASDVVLPNNKDMQAASTQSRGSKTHSTTIQQPFMLSLKIQ